MARYVISALNLPFCEPERADAHENDPENAIIQWFRCGEKNPTCASIQAQTKEDGMKLLKWADLNFEKLEVWAKEHKCPYKTDWLKEQISSQVKNKTCSMQWEYDEVFPFCVG